MFTDEKLVRAYEKEVMIKYEIFKDFTEEKWMMLLPVGPVPNA
ncbi:MAG: hypothetical protein AAF335_00070 [Bacteroidota bacterium]